MRREILIAVPGGALSPGLLRELARFAHQNRVDRIRVTHRQGLALRFPSHIHPRLQLPAEFRELSEASDNAMSSVWACHPENSFAWINESRLLELLRSLPKQEGFSIALSEPRAKLPGLWESDLDFAASPVAEHWRLSWRQKGKRIFLDSLVPSHLLSSVASLLMADLSSENGATIDLSEKIQNKFSKSMLENISSESAGLPGIALSQEGFLEDRGSYQLGIFRNNHNFSALFLDELGYLCRKNQIGKIYLTPMHGILIKNIPRESKAEWSELMSRHNINLRHNQNELGFRMGVAELSLRSYLLSQLDKHDLSLGSQICSIERDAKRPWELFSSDLAVVLKKAMLFNQYDLFVRQNGAEDSEKNSFRHLGRFVNRRELAQAFCEALKERRLFETSGSSAQQKERQEATESTQARAFQLRQGQQCPDCGFLYEEDFGDPLSLLPAGTPWAQTPENYECPVCACPKESFISIKIHTKSKGGSHVLQT